MVYDANLSTNNGRSAPVGGISMKIITIEEIQKRISEKWPSQPYEILEYTKVTQRFTLKCGKCGRIKTYSSFANFINPKRFSLCPCYNPNHSDTKHSTNYILAKEITLAKKNTFISFDYIKETKKYTITVTCHKCGQQITKPITEYLKNPDCYYCETNQKLNTLGFIANLPAEYELIGEYKNSTIPVLIKHKCGFIFSIIPSRLKNYSGCPKCNKKLSKGANKIKKWLENNNHEFELEKRFNWQSNSLRRYDFYISKYNTIIEYHGEQHYKENKYFKTPLIEQQQIDIQKRDEALNQKINYLEIGFFENDLIDNILSNWFNDYPVTGVGASAPKWRASIYNG